MADGFASLPAWGARPVSDVDGVTSSMAFSREKWVVWRRTLVAIDPGQKIAARFAA
jgi:hypothetical protein